MRLMPRHLEVNICVIATFGDEHHKSTLVKLTAIYADFFMSMIIMFSDIRGV